MDRKPVRVLHVVPVLGRGQTVGGAIRAVVDFICEQQASQNVEPRLCVLGPEDPDWAHYGLSERPVFLGFPGAVTSIGESWRCIRKLRTLLRDSKPDIVHSHLWLADLFTAAAVRGLDVRHVVHVHDTRPWLVDEAFLRRVRRNLTRSLLRASRATFIACSEGARTYTAENLPVAAERIHVIPYGLEKSWFASTPPARNSTGCAFVIGAAGRLQPEKGHEYLIRAVEQLQQRGVTCELRIAGGGSRVEELTALTRLLGVESQVKFLGYVVNMRAFYDDIDVFALPSLSTEGLPISILEAMALGKAIVASNIIGPPEEIADKISGLLVPPTDVTALADAIEHLCRNPDTREQMGRKAAERAKNFHVAGAAESIERYYHDLLAQPQRPWSPAPQRPKRFVINGLPLLPPSDTRPGVLHVVQGLGLDGAVYGAARLALTMTRYMQASGPYRADLCVLTGNDPYWSAYGLATPPHFLHVPHVQRNPFRLIASARRLRTLLLANNASIVHSHTWPVSLIAGIAVRGLPIRHVVHIHDMRPWLASRRWRHRLRRVLHRWALRSPNTSFVACTEVVAEYAKTHLLPRNTVVTTIQSGIDLSAVNVRRDARATDGPVAVGMAAAFQSGKGYRHLLRAIAEARTRGVRLELKLAGSGAEMTAIRELAKELHVEDCTSFLGLVRDMSAFMSSLDICVLPSLSEGLPLSILEAMAHGVPVIATKVGGIPAAVRDGVDGLLVPPGDDPALVTAIERLARDPELRAAMSRHGQDRVRSEFDVRQMVDRMASFYGTLSV